MTTVSRLLVFWQQNRAGLCSLDGIDASEPCSFCIRGKEARLEGVAGELAEFVAGEFLLCVGQQEFIGQVGAEEGRVVRVEGDEQAGIKEAAQRVGSD